MRRVRVAHVITRLCKGGAQENTFHSVRLADRSRYEADLIAGYPGAGEHSMEDAVRAAGIEIVRVPSLVRDPSPWKDWLAYRELVRLFRERRYDIVHTHTSKAGYLGRLAAAKVRVPIVVHTPHGHVFFGYFNQALTSFFTALERHAARKTDRLIALTQRGIDEHLARGVGRPEQWTAIFSGIDLAPFATAGESRDRARRALGIAPDEHLVGAVGRLEPVKGLTYFVRAAHRIAGECPRARFILAGDGMERGRIEAESAVLGDRFHMLGLRSDVPALMAAMDVCVVPSLNEGMGRVILEAAAAGTPVVASRVGGIPEVVRDGETGVLVAPGEPESIARAVLDLLRDDARRRAMGDAARAHAAGFSVQSMVRRLESLYETLIQEKRLDA